VIGQLEGSLMSNPWLSLWLSGANTWASAIRGFWTAELRRQQTAMANEMVRQMTNFWVRTWMAQIADDKPKRRR
jgi:hypothetical protein